MEAESPGWVAARTLQAREDVELMFLRIHAPCRLEAQAEHVRDMDALLHRPNLYYRDDPNETHLMVFQVVHPKQCDCQEVAI